MPDKVHVINVVTTAGVTIESILFALLGITFVLFLQSATQSPASLRISPIARITWQMTFFIFVLAVINALMTGLAFCWLLIPNDLLYISSIAIFLFQVAIPPVIIGIITFRFMKR